jgi:hypothetical protein
VTLAGPSDFPAPFVIMEISLFSPSFIAEKRDEG